LLYVRLARDGFAHDEIHASRDESFFSQGLSSSGTSSAASILEFAGVGGGRAHGVMDNSSGGQHWLARSCGRSVDSRRATLTSLGLRNLLHHRQPFFYNLINL
jgi:hypothetical protein